MEVSGRDRELCFSPLGERGKNNIMREEGGKREYSLMNQRKF